MQKDRYTLIDQSLTIRNIIMTALLECLDLHACFLCLQAAIAAGDYPSSNLMCLYSGRTATSPL